MQLWDFAVHPGAEPEVVCPSAPGYRYDDLKRKYTKEVDISEGFVLEPGAFALGWTKEVVALPSRSRVAARVEGKSSLARIGLAVHVTAPTIHAGFSGAIQLEFCNLGSIRIKLVPDMPVCQMIFELTYGTPEKGYAGMFLNQSAE